MASEKQKEYQRNIRLYKSKRSIWMSGLKAFFSGGMICLIGQAIINGYDSIFSISREDAVQWMLVTLILLSSVLTGFGLYRRGAHFAGAGLLVPITGLTNLMTSAAMEHRQDGIIQGIAGHLLKIAGAIVVTGVVMAYLISAVRLIIHAIIR